MKTQKLEGESGSHICPPSTNGSFSAADGTLSLREQEQPVEGACTEKAWGVDWEPQAIAAISLFWVYFCFTFSRTKARKRLPMFLNERLSQVSSPSQGGWYEFVEMPVMDRRFLPSPGRCTSAQFRAWSQKTQTKQGHHVSIPRGASACCFCFFLSGRFPTFPCQNIFIFIFWWCLGFWWEPLKLSCGGSFELVWLECDTWSVSKEGACHTEIVQHPGPWELAIGARREPATLRDGPWELVVGARISFQA